MRARNSATLAASTAVSPPRVPPSRLSATSLGSTINWHLLRPLAVRILLRLASLAGGALRPPRRADGSAALRIARLADHAGAVLEAVGRAVLGVRDDDGPPPR
jgi:hypothetical protein